MEDDGRVLGVKVVRACKWCHGDGVVDVQDEEGRWDEEECYFCEGTGVEEVRVSLGELKRLLEGAGRPEQDGPKGGRV
ncbi:MAG: hypothetical protein K6U79_10070 [Firmicutes bacterium]|nr:hypothetical protein [Bacillota bacterium]